MVAVLAVAALLAAAPAVPVRAAGACAEAGARDDAPVQERAVRCLVNQERTRRGLARLRPDDALAAAAGAHSRDMVRRRFFDHTSPGGGTPGRRARQAGYDWTSLGEAIAWGAGPYATPASTVRRWMASPPHRAILLEPRLRDIGIGVADGAPVRDAPDATTVTAVLGRR